MYFYDDNEYDNKKAFKNKYGKLTKESDIIKDIESKDNNSKEKNKNEESTNRMLIKKRKRHDSSDEEEEKKENKKKKEEIIEEKEDFINKINNVNELIEEKEEENKLKEKENENDVKNSWKKNFVNIEEINKNKIEVKESSKLLDDPMKNLLSKNKLIEETNELIKKRGFYLPRCKFAPLINRFNIKPGYRWDGFNRSNGFENKIMNIKFNINNK